MRSGANLPSLGSFNRTVVLDAIRRAPAGISRVEIAANTGLSAQTITNLTRRLLDDRLIREAGTSAVTIGQPRRLLAIRPDGGYAIGVHIDPSVVTTVLVNLGGTVVAHLQTAPPNDPGSAVADIAASVDEVIADAGIDRATVFGLGVATPGPIDMDSGVVIDPPLLRGWRNVPVRELVSRATGFPVLFDKDVNAAAVAHVWSGSEQAHRNFVFYYLGTGTGMGIVLRGEVIRGASGNAGDSGGLLIQDGTGAAQLGPTILPWHILGDADRPATRAGAVDLHARFTHIAERAVSGDAAAADALDRGAHAIASSLVTVINLLDVDHVVFGGAYWAPVSAYMLARVPALVHRNPVRVGHRPLTFESSRFGTDVAAIGAASLVLDNVLSPRPELLLI